MANDQAHVRLLQKVLGPAAFRQHTQAQLSRLFGWCAMALSDEPALRNREPSLRERALGDTALKLAQAHGAPVILDGLSYADVPISRADALKARPKR